jgi:hypothetical protein
MGQATNRNKLFVMGVGSYGSSRGKVKRAEDVARGHDWLDKSKNSCPNFVHRKLYVYLVESPILFECPFNFFSLRNF